MRFIYALRVVFFSFEALVIFVSWLVFVYLNYELQALSFLLSLNNDVVKFIAFIPMAIAVWVLREIRLLLQNDKDTVRILTAWPDYWKLKMHAWVSLGFAVLFAAISILPWIGISGIGPDFGPLMFFTGLVGQLVLALSVYAARIAINEKIANINCG